MIQPILLTLGGVLTAISGVMGAWAVILGRRNEKRSATKDETQQAFDLQQLAMENVSKDNERLRKRQDDLHDQVNRLVGQLGEVTVNHRKCEDQLIELGERLRLTEAQIHELGG